MASMQSKKAYTRPQLTCLGTVEQLTLAQVIPPPADNQGLPGGVGTAS